MKNKKQIKITEIGLFIALLVALFGASLGSDLSNIIGNKNMMTRTGNLKAFVPTIILVAGVLLASIMPNYLGLVIVIVLVLLASVLGYNFKEHFTSGEKTPDEDMGRATDEGKDYNPFKNTTESTLGVENTGVGGDSILNAENTLPPQQAGTQSAPSQRPTTYSRSQIPSGEQDKYILKSQVVPPVCPKCPEQSACPRQKPCQPCPPCARCPEPAFTCKKVPNYNVPSVSNILPSDLSSGAWGGNTNPMPRLASFAKFD